ncbi:hypothetical protein PspLS_10051 [Pyricularia sp. CBS 133598]|nr:hypothetical protein PspLS_10051 [Pyricularia sp. CBS 133598]
MKVKQPTVINWAYFVRRYFERPKIDCWVVLKVKSYIAMKAPVKLVMVKFLATVTLIVITTVVRVIEA